MLSNPLLINELRKICNLNVAQDICFIIEFSKMFIFIKIKIKRKNRIESLILCGLKEVNIDLKIRQFPIHFLIDP